MSTRSIRPAAAAILAMGLLGGCAATPPPVAYSGLASAPRLAPNTGKTADRIPFVYATEVNWRRYYRVILEPVRIYRGPDAQFGRIAEDGREKLRGYMQDAFTGKLGSVFELTDRPGPNTLRIRLTLTGAKTTKAVLGTLSHFDIAGGAYNAVQSVRGKEGTMTGSVVYAVEIHDAVSNRLLASYISRQYPNAMNIKRTFGALSAAQAGIDKGADELVERLGTKSPA